MREEEMTTMMQDQLRYLEALYEILCSSDDAETVRVAAAALTGTTGGRQFLAANPIKL